MAEERLFLLEILVDKILFLRSPCFSDKDFRTCVTFDFLNNNPLEICADDSRPCPVSCPEIKEVKAGKSCLFALKESDIEGAKTNFKINLNVEKSLPCGCLPTKIPMGKCAIDMSPQFDEAQKESLEKPNTPVSKSLKDSFKIANDEGEETGSIFLFLRISCFGKLIVTKFQVPGAAPGQCNATESSGRACDPKREWRAMDDPCFCGSRREASGGGAGQENCNATEEVCFCSGGPPAKSTAMSCRNPEPYCLHVPKGAGGTQFEEMGTTLNGNELKIRIPKNEALIKKMSPSGTGIQKATDGAGCLSCCANNKLCLQVPGDRGAGEAATHVSYGGEGCTPIPVNVPGAPDASRKLHPNKDVFVLKVSKKSEGTDRKANLELEFVTPKGPEKKGALRYETRDTQYEEEKKKPAKGKKGKKKK